MKSGGHERNMYQSFRYTFEVFAHLLIRHFFQIPAVVASSLASMIGFLSCNPSTSIKQIHVFIGFGMVWFRPNHTIPDHTHRSEQSNECCFIPSVELDSFTDPSFISTFKISKEYYTRAVSYIEKESGIHSLPVTVVSLCP